MRWGGRHRCLSLADHAPFACANIFMLPPFCVGDSARVLSGGYAGPTGALPCPQHGRSLAGLRPGWGPLCCSVRVRRHSGRESTRIAREGDAPPGVPRFRPGWPSPRHRRRRRPLAGSPAGRRARRSSCPWRRHRPGGRGRAAWACRRSSRSRRRGSRAVVQQGHRAERQRSGHQRAGLGVPVVFPCEARDRGRLGGADELLHLDLLVPAACRGENILRRAGPTQGGTHLKPEYNTTTISGVKSMYDT